LQERKRKNLKTVLVLCLARPRIITAIDTLCTAVVHAYLPGDEGGTALASLLSGRKVFSGKLPFTYPRASGDIVHYDRKTTEDNDINFGRKAYNPLYDFGHGLSYTEFSYDSLTTNTTNDSVYLAVNVKNTGKRDGKEAVQVYYRDEFASVTPSVKKLVAFKKISLTSGKSQTVTFAFPKSELSFIDANLNRIFESGDFTFMVKQLSKTMNIEWE
jgi:beta-glucosidase